MSEKIPTHDESVKLWAALVGIAAALIGIVLVIVFLASLFSAKERPAKENDVESPIVAGDAVSVYYLLADPFESEGD